MITNDINLAETFNEYFGNIVSKIIITSFLEIDYDLNTDNIENTITKFEGHQT